MVVNYFNEEDILRQKSIKIDSLKESKLYFEELVENLKLYSNGVGLALPQISIPKTAFIAKVNDNIERYFINPKINYIGNKTKIYVEGCLSIPGIYESVWRYEKVQIEYLDKKMKLKKEIFSGFNSILIQHEYDHLNGILFIDRFDEKQKEKYKGMFNFETMI
jgi:peptide deformylase